MKGFDSLRRIWALAKKESKSFLLSHVFYGTVVFFLLFLSIGLFYVQRFFLLDAASLRPFFSLFPLVYVFVIPAITMKSWAEEKKTGTLELLLTMPFSEIELCIGKFVSSFMALVVMLVLSTLVPLSLLPLGSFDPGLIVAEYFGVLLLGACAISISLFFSSLSKNQAASFLGSAAILLALMLPGLVSMPSWLSGFVNLFSLSFHFQSFARGLLDSRDIFFFIICAALFLFLNTRSDFFRKKRIALTLLWFAIMLLSFLISMRVYARVDITKNRANTLSEFSKSLIQNLDEPLFITYFISDRLDRAHPLAGEVSDLLEEYSAASSGMVRFSRKDPQKHGLLREMEEINVYPRQMEIVEKNESTLAPVYSAILIEYLDAKEVLPSVYSLDSLEYDLSSKIHSMLKGRGRELGIIVGDASKDGEHQYAALYEKLLAAGFDVSFLRPGEEIHSDVDCLFVLGGADYLDEWDLFSIDSFIQKGGGVFFAVDAINIDFQNNFSVNAIEDRGLLAVLAYYGVLIRQALVVDSSCLNLSYQVSNPAGSFEINTIRYPLWLEVSSANINREHPLSSGFKGLDLYWASPLEIHPPQGVHAIPLISSSVGAWLQTRNFSAALNMVYTFDQEKDETLGTKILGASLEGLFPSAFAGDAQRLEHKPARLIVAGDSDFAGTLMSATMAEDRNLDFLVRSALWLSGDDGLLEIRKRGTEALRLDKIQNPQKRNAAKDFSLVLNVFVIPALVIITGFFIIRRGTRK